MKMSTDEDFNQNIYLKDSIFVVYYFYIYTYIFEIFESENARKLLTRAGFKLATPDFVRQVLYQLSYQATSW